VYPALQRHAASAVCIVSACPEFAGQVAHGAEPLELLYWFAGQAVQVPPSGQEKPWKHWHALASVCIVSKCPELARQVAHGAEPLVLLYWLAWQAVHGPPSAPVKPWKHLHAVTCVCACVCVLELSEHKVHAAEPAFGLNVPCVQA